MEKQNITANNSMVALKAASFEHVRKLRELASVLEQSQTTFETNLAADCENAALFIEQNYMQATVDYTKQVSAAINALAGIDYIGGVDVGIKVLLNKVKDLEEKYDGMYEAWKKAAASK